MSRPTRTDLNASSSGWVTRFNDNAEALIDAPVPFVQYADETALGTAKNAKLNTDCPCLVGSDLYTSDGTNWKRYRELLTYIASVDTGTITLPELVTLYNDLLADMQDKGWMS